MTSSQSDWLHVQADPQSVVHQVGEDADATEGLVEAVGGGGVRGEKKMKIQLQHHQLPHRQQQQRLHLVDDCASWWLVYVRVAENRRCGATGGGI